MSQQAQAMVQTKQKTSEPSSAKGSILPHAAVIPAITPVHSGILQRCSGGVECEECRQKRLGMLQRAAVSSAPANENGNGNGVPPIVHEVLSSSGQPLDAGTRAFMEPRFGHDFSQVRVHTDAKAAESARAVNALAYTVGRDVVFGTGQYGPGTNEGRTKKSNSRNNRTSNHPSSSTDIPEWIPSFKRPNDEANAKFPWQLKVNSLPCMCDALRWEQFMSGGFTIHDRQRNSRTYDVCETMQKINSKSRRFDNWCDDLLPGMTPGPRPVSAHPDAQCSDSTYTFEDSPGFDKNFDDEINKMQFIGITWHAKVEHKLWCTDKSVPFHTERFDLTGEHWQDGPDTRETK